ncbi:dienelactone hydrolase family protein [Olivibacter sitiensis]|uniref:dienelactone hydrolase family protein n=1 Tax=Olivibacter sitiensis TaxID=376470 RepID=UPI00042A5394|nr:dienelactone hydrolase family protein [Olivibacter sitiensis]
MDKELIKLYDEYTHKPLSRQDFIRQLVSLTGSMAVAMSVLPLLENNYAHASEIPNEDIINEDITFNASNGPLTGFLSRPKKTRKHGCVLVIHENRGLNAHIKDIAKRLAIEGFIALALDALSSYGGTPEDQDEARTLIGKLDPEINLTNYLDTLEYLRQLPYGNGKTGCIGFCWGGGIANDLATKDPRLNAAVSYYGRQARQEDVPHIKAKLLLHYAGLDERINVGIPAFQEALDSNHIDYQLFIYEGVNHAFNNETSAARYDEQASKLAWKRSIDLFNSTLM